MSVTPSPSDLESAIPIIKEGLIGYRNLLSYVSSLGLPVIPPASLQTQTWNLIDTGAFSTVWKASLNLAPLTVVAIKQPKASFTREKLELENELQNQALSTMIQEMRILAHPQLKDHPNLPHALGVFFQEDENPSGIRPCLVLELAVSDLHSHLQKTPPHELNGKEMIRLSSQVAGGICALHGLVHGDIKPKNVLLFMREGILTAAVSDLGTCGIAFQASGIIPGTRAFYAPEVFEKSVFHHLANQPARDIYSFGLLVFCILTRCSADPFSSTDQFDLQHDSNRCIGHILREIRRSSTVPELEKVVQMTVKTNPAERVPILELIESLAIALGEQDQGQIVQDQAERTLLNDPDSPRVNALAQMPLPASLMSKLLSEFIIASNSSGSIRLALTMAAFYSGALGPGIERPWDVVAKTQWLLKAVELGSYAAVSGIVSDRHTVTILEEFGRKVLIVTKPFFKSPSINYETLTYRLRGFAAMPDVESLNILVFLGEGIPGETERSITRLTYEKNERQRRIRHAIPNLSTMEMFNLNRQSDIEVVDSDAYDIVLSDASDINTAVYNNNLEKFMSLAESSSLAPGDTVLDYYMALAIFNGSQNVVRYLLDQYHVDPNRSWSGMSHINDAVLFRRQSIVQMLLDHNATIEPASGNTISALHLAPRHEDPELVTLLCEHLKSKNTLATVLNSSTAEGDLAGFTPIYVAMMCGSWKVVRTLLEFGANANESGDGSTLLDMSVLPTNTAAPLSILQNLLQKGAMPDSLVSSGPSPLQMAIQSSNVLATFHLLLHNAPIIFLDSSTAVDEAESSVLEMQTGPRIEVLNVDGDPCPNGWEDCSEACSVILDMVRIAAARKAGWREDLGHVLGCASLGCRLKMWILDQHVDKATMLVEINIPP